MKVGFIGLGGIGKPMATNVLKAGFELTVHDIREKPVRDLVQLGAKSAGSPREVAAASDIVLASLSSLEASEQVALADNGVLAGANKGDIYIDMSTITPVLIRKIARLAADRGVEVLDAPVSGSVPQRIEGKLSIMVGGNKEALERARPVLEKIGSNIIHVGDVGTGCTVKLVNNLIALSSIVINMEGIVLGVKAGLDVEKLCDVIKVSSGGSILFESIMNQTLTRRFEPPVGEVASQALHTCAKDMKLAIDLAEELSFPMPMGSAALQMWLAGKAKGLRDKEMWALITLFEDMAGVQVRRQSP